eukprot:4928871-Ditylum_brightwellii.AAC.1
MTNMHAPGGTYSSDNLAVRGQPGIRYVEVACPVGTTAAIEKFYKEMLGCTVSQLSGEDGQIIAVQVGPGVHLIYSESSSVTSEDYNAMEG